MTRIGAWKHVRALWPGFSLALPLPYLGLGALALAQRRFRWDHAAVVLVALALFVIGPRTKKLFLGSYPCGLVAVFYDAMRNVENVGLTPGRVHLCDLRAAEARFFGTTMGGERVTWQDWFLVHHRPALDLLCAIPYGTFLFVIVATAVLLFVRDYPRMLRFSWCWLVLNVAGFATYHFWPAAPPWYFHAHGCVVDLSAHASEGAALARVDARFSTDYFAGMYGRASDVFGAVPSLHCAYALLIVLVGWGAFGWLLRTLSAAFLAVMCFGAVYLDHHWVIDVIAGLLYCAAVVGVFAVLPSRSRGHAGRLQYADPPLGRQRQRRPRSCPRLNGSLSRIDRDVNRPVVGIDRAGVPARRGRAGAECLDSGGNLSSMIHGGFSLLVCLFGALLYGCDECSTSDEPACYQGDSIRSCAAGDGIPGRNTWYIQPCEAPNPYCVALADGGQPACVAQPQPSPECASRNTAAFCAQNAQSGCESGYLIVGPACDPGTTCTMTGAGCIFCSDGTAVTDPTCAAGSEYTCFDGELFGCNNCGLRAGDASTCQNSLEGPDGSCVTARSDGGIESFCALSSQPDERCDGGGTGFCSTTEQVSLACKDGFAVRSIPCARCAPAGGYCVDYVSGDE